MAHCIPCFVKADEIGVSGSMAKYGTSPTITTETAIYNAQQIANATPIPNGRSLCGFFTCRGQKGVKTNKAICTHGPLYSSSIRPSQQDSLLYTQFSRTHPSSISSSIHSIHYGTHLSLYLNISMRDLVLKDLLRRI
jgi:hypothetical protein